LDETQKDDTEKQTEIPASADHQYTIEDETNDRIKLFSLKTEAKVISSIVVDLLSRKEKLNIKADAIQEKLDGQQSFFEEPSGGDVGSVVQDNQQ